MITSLLLLLAARPQVNLDPDDVPYINLYVTENIAPSNQIRVNINTHILPVVNMVAYRIDGIKWFTRKDNDPTPPRIGSAVAHWRVAVETDQQAALRQKPRYFNRQVNIPSLPVGIYRLEATGGGAKAVTVVNVTNLAVVVKRSPTHVMTWVTEFRSGSVIPNALIGLYARGGKLLRSAQTNSDGVAIMTSSPGQEPVIVRRGPDLAGIQSGAENPDGVLHALFQTDRPIYRPGQTVYFKSILRITHGQGYQPVSDEKIVVKLRDPRDNPLDEVELKPSALGTVSGEFKVPQEGMLGPYTLSLEAAKQSAYQTITVAEYRKPEFKVDIAPAAHYYLSGQDLKFNVDSKFYFGAVLPQAEIRWQARRVGSPYRFDYEPASAWFYGGDGNLYPADTYARQPFVAEGTAYTDDKGKATIVVNSHLDDPDAVYTLSATVSDNARRVVSAQASVPVYEALLRIGMVPLVSYVNFGGPIPLSLRVVDVEGKPQPAKVHLRVTVDEWDEKSEKPYVKLLSDSDVEVPPAGIVTVNLPAKEEGFLQIEASTTDSTGRVTRTRTGVDVVAPFEPHWHGYKPPPSVTVKLDKRQYRPGETVKSYLEATEAGHPILSVIEGRDTFRYKVFKPSKPGQSWIFTATDAYSPNAYVSACEWVKGRLVASETILPVPDPKKMITVKVEPDKPEYKPGDQASFTVHTLTSTGQGTPAEVSLAVVDEAIYALSPDTTPDPYGFYWGLRSNHVSTFESFPQEVSGGAYQRVNSVAAVRQRFEDTAYWNGIVETDGTGTGHVSFEMPGNLTSWRATARAVDGVTAVGSGKINVAASRPLTIRLATPRQLVQGDHLVLIGTVNGKLNHDVPCMARLTANGVQLADGAERKFMLDGKSGQATLQWTLDATSIPASGMAELQADVYPVDRSREDPNAMDALKVSIPVYPKGVVQASLVGGSVNRSATAEIVLPTDKLEPATKVSVEVWSGVKSTQIEKANEILRYPRYGSLAAAQQLEAAAAVGRGNHDDAVREAIALLSRTETGEGWGWWEGVRADPIITSKVLESLLVASKAGYRVYDTMLKWGIGGCQTQYLSSQLWEHKALLAAALTYAGEKQGVTWIAEVRARGMHLSPYARLKMAEALAHYGEKEEAAKAFQDAAKDASIEGADAYFPTGEGVGWTADETQTTAEALCALMATDEQPELQTKLVRWLLRKERDTWLCSESSSEMVRALGLYLVKHPDASKLGAVTVDFNGTSIPVEASRVSSRAVATVPVGMALSGVNRVKITRSEGGEAFYTIHASVYRPNLRESTHGIRAMRRYELRDDAGVWREINRPIQPGEPVRCTVVVWGDSLSDALIVREPLPAGFEFVDTDWYQGEREEVRDSAIIHYLVNAEAPETFRYYIRAESDGRLTALPISAQYLRRPGTSGQSAAEVIEVRKP